MVRSCMSSDLGRLAVVGTGLMGDGYDLAILGAVLNVLRAQFVCDHPTLPLTCEGKLSESEFAYFESFLGISAILGALVGHILFGALADRIGRRVVFIVTGSMVIGGSLLSSLHLFDDSTSPRAVLVQIVVCRTILGLGIGGEVVLAATITSEVSSCAKQDVMLRILYLMVNLGSLLAAGVMLLTSVLGFSYSFMWRFGFAFGAVVPGLSMYFRGKMHESESFQTISKQRSDGVDSVQFDQTMRRYFWHLVGTMLTFFISNGCMFANGTFQGQIMGTVQLLQDPIQGTFIKMLLTSLVVTFACLVNILLGYTQVVTLKFIQLHGFVALSLLFGVCAVGYHWMVANKAYLLLGVCAASCFFLYCGIGTATYLIPVQVFPSQVKGTFQGLSATSGKVGAALGVFLTPFLHLSTSDGKTSLFAICSGLCALGAMITCVLTPSYDQNMLSKQSPDGNVMFIKLYWQKEDAQKETSSYPL